MSVYGLGIRDGSEYGRTSDALAPLEDIARDIGMPTSGNGTFLGSAQAFQSSLASQPFVILAALVAVYISLGVLYESLVHPLTILSTLPSACIGAIVLLWAWQLDFSIMALIGLILQIGRASCRERVCQYV